MEQKTNILKTEKLELEILADKASFLESQVRRCFQFVLFTLTAISFLTSSYLLVLYLTRSCVKFLKVWMYCFFDTHVSKYVMKMKLGNMSCSEDLTEI